MYRLNIALRTLSVICTLAFTAAAQTTSTDNVAALGGGYAGTLGQNLIISLLTNGMPLTGFWI